MGVILSGIAAAIIIAAGIGYFMLPERIPAWQAYSKTESTRVGDPGYNLVGRNWTGDPGGAPADEGITEANKDG
ncbi:hypothetical protein [Propylenella binzhouense]|uniref:Uncharacterized protein n=1 Tax=Propylenella binzhouense TaxID=2555902 RepID=A0A964T8K7_9HYPH|nr:hypothetical protein [Propylenella binzhouense]MYZ50518.1 hypothetical protein [Propylenella binzhouense]